jgi:hypothetical protein
MHDLPRSAYTADEKDVFRIVATATVYETFTYRVSEIWMNRGGWKHRDVVRDLPKIT